VSREIDEVLAFLERFQPRPEMEAEAFLQADLRVRLERFADGLCEEGEREEICEILKGEPGLVRWVAERVKQRRPRGPEESPH
jgi:hypothetical protein